MFYLLALIIIALELTFVVGLLIVIIRMQRCKPAQRVFGHITINGPGVPTMSFEIEVGQTKVATVVYSDAAGVTHPIFSVPVWAVTPADALTLTPAADGMTCSIVGAVVEGCSLTASAESDPTPGKNTTVATISGTVIPAENTQGTITVA